MHLGEKACEVVNWVLLLLKIALQLRFTRGSTGYEQLQQHFPLPSLCMLRRKMQAVVFEPGILDEVFNLLQLKAQQWKSQECECCLTLDEMAITPSVECDQSNVTVGGYLRLLLEDNLVCSLFGRACVCYNWYLLQLRRRKS